MSEQGKVTMLLCSGLEPAEQEKVERLDGLIAAHLIQAGSAARLCKASGAGDQRVLEFVGQTGVVGRVRMADFLSAPDQTAIAAITLSGS